MNFSRIAGAAYVWAAFDGTYLRFYVEGMDRFLLDGCDFYELQERFDVV